MATKTFWFTNTGNGTYSSMYMQMDGTAPTTVTTTCGWTVAKLAPPNFSYFIWGGERDTTSFMTSLPAHPPATSYSGAYSDQMTGAFAAGNWTFYLRWIAVTNGGALDPRFQITVWKATEFWNAYTVLTSAWLTTSTITNLNTTAQEATVVWNAPAIQMSGDRLMLCIALDIQGAGANNGADCLMRVGNEGNGCKIVTTDFSEGMGASGALGTINVTGPEASVSLVDATLYQRTTTGVGK